MAENSGASLKRSMSGTEQVGYSFSKSNRFNKEKITPGFYSIPNVIKRQGTIFGSEKRPEFVKPSLSPGPSYYNPNHLGPKLGKVISDSNIGLRLKAAKAISPGPGDYLINRDLLGPKFSIKGRYKSKEPAVTPSGANYNPNFSVMYESRYSKISFGYGNKIDASKGKISPGPGSYSIPITFPKIGRANPLVSKSFSKKSLSTSDDKVFLSSNVKSLLKN